MKIRKILFAHLKKNTAAHQASSDLHMNSFPACQIFTRHFGDNYTSVEDCGHFLKEVYEINNGTAKNAQTVIAEQSRMIYGFFNE